MPTEPLPTDAIREVVELFSCSHCGVSRSNGPAWCDKGCGRDYNKMTAVKYVPISELQALEDALTEAQRINNMVDEDMDREVEPDWHEIAYDFNEQLRGIIHSATWATLAHDRKVGIQRVLDAFELARVRESGEHV